MPLTTRTYGRRTHHSSPRTTRHVRTTRTTRTTPRHGGGFFSRRHAAPVHHQKRKPTMKDKISGALLKLKGSLTHRPGQKAAGTRRMHGTDGRGSRRRYRY
ncbi:hypothetical protein B0I35DRAFT_474744 [Stachybotrys elegans]|uniref:Uncharacterized protein n=1 Tax=Stachybotrys elegans TaxID=80388 RepID=A0A8K0WUU7_9HYPO|nr:hypothetical protein B0I35DRAFT_474744 [Stachybotrys elegans]